MRAVIIVSLGLGVAVGCATNAPSDPGCRCTGDIEGVGFLDVACGEAACISGVGLFCVSAGSARNEPSACGVTPSCGDGACSAGEDATTCMVDCAGVTPGCGDGSCSADEDAMTCMADCAAMCGDMICSASEVPATCPADCGTVCGDASCGPGETAASCENDCPARCGDGACTHGETATSCGADCAPVCGDGVCSTGETCSSCERDCGVCVPELVDVRLIGGVVAPYDDVGETWDGIGRVSAAEQSQIRSAALSVDPYVGLAAVLGLLANDAWQDADVHGQASIAVDGTFRTDLDQGLDAVTDNTPSAEWVGPPGWDYVPAARSRIRVVLWDEDVTFDDRIGTVDLSFEHLAAAYRSGRIYPVPVANQGTKVLFIRISVTASPP